MLERTPQGDPTREIPMSPRNLLTHRDETVVAIGEIEGEAWVRSQRSGGDFSVPGALEQIARLSELGLDEAETVHGVYVIYGDGGTTRYRVMQSGEVLFMPFYDAKGEKTAMARALGFAMA